MISSGDSGVYDRIPFEVIEFHPSFPACCPSVTAVGGTTWGKDGDANGDALDDTAWSHSGGGFTPSKYFTGIAEAPWQAAAVAASLNGTAGVKLPPSWQWDAKGRGLPDVS